MYLTDEVLFPSFFPFGLSGKQAPAKNLDLVTRGFDEALLHRLKNLGSATKNPSMFSLSWLCLAVDLLSSTHADAEKIISDMMRSSSGLDDSLSLYLDDSVKLLDACNSIISEIERLRHSRLLIQFVLHLLDFSGEDRRVPSLEKLRCARNSLSEWKTSAPMSKKGNLTNPAVLIRDLALRLGNPLHGKVSSVGKLVHHTMYAVGALAVFVIAVVVAALTGTSEMIQVRVPSEFLWSEAFNGLQSRVSGEIQRLFPGEKRLFIGDLDSLESRVRSVCDVLDSVTGGGDNDDVAVGGEVDMLKLETAVKELKTVTETFSNGLDRLFDGVNELFHAVLSTRDGVLENLRMGPQKNGKKSCK